MGTARVNARRPRLRVALLAAAAAGLLAAAGALAYFVSSATATAPVSVGSIEPPTNVTTQQSGPDVAVSWTAATLSSGAAVQGYAVTRSDGATVCGSPTLVTLDTCTDTSVPPGSYTYKVDAVYNSFDAPASSASVAVLTAPSITQQPASPSANTAPTFGWGGGGGSGYQCRIDGGPYAPCTSPDALSGLADGSHTFDVQATQGSSSGPAASYTWTVDTTAPTIATKPADPSNDPSPSFAFSHAEPSYTFRCRLDAAGYGPCTSPYTLAGLSNGPHTFRVQGVDADGVATAAASYTWTVDTTPPTNLLSISSGTANVLLAGSTLYYRGDIGGSFALTDAVTDPGSNPVSAGFPAIATSGWTHPAETVSSGSGSPPTISYTSSTFSFGANPSNPSGYAVTSTDAVGNSAASSLTFVNDTTAPSGGALTVAGTPASGAGSSSTTANAGFAIDSRTDFGEAQSPTQSGLGSSVLTVQSETLTAGACGAPGSGGPFMAPVTLTGAIQPAGIVTGYCYLYTLTGTDAVGNSASISTTIALDTTTPSTPTLAFSGLSGNTVYSSAFNTLYFRPAPGGAYTVTASSSAPSGIAGYTFSSLSASNFAGSQSGPQEAYTFGASATAPGSSPTVTATSNAGVTSAPAGYNLVRDTTAPTGGALTVDGAAASAGGSSSSTTSAGFPINGRTDFSEVQSASQSGLHASTLTVQSETLTGTTCGAPGSGGPFTTPVTITGTTQPPGIVTGACYRYTLTATDNVGNSATIATTVTATKVVTIPVGANPQGVGVDPLTNTIYVANTGGDNVSVINGATNTVTATVAVGSHPFPVVVDDPTTDTVYVANSDANSVSVISGATNTVIATIPVGSTPQGLGVDTATNTIYVANSASNTVSVISGATNTVTATIAVGSVPVGVAVDTVTNTVYVTNSFDADLSVINGATNTVTATVPAGNDPDAVAVDPATDTVYVADYNAGSVSVISGLTNTLTATVAVGPNPAALAVDPATNTVYVANLTGHSVSVIDGATNTVTGTIVVGSEPDGIGVNPLTDVVYVADFGSNAVSVFAGS